MSLFRPNREARTANLSAAELIAQQRYGTRSSSGVPVNDDTAMRLSAVWGCVDLISELVSTLPVDEYRRAPDGELIAQPRSPLIEDPAGDGYGFEVWSRQVMVSLLLRGNAFGWVEAIGGDGWPTQISTVHPDEMTARRPYGGGPVDWYRNRVEV